MNKYFIYFLNDDKDGDDKDDDAGHNEQDDIYFLFECRVVRLYDDVFVVILLVSV